MLFHRRRTTAALSVVVATLALAGCGGGDKGTNPTPGPLELNSGGLAFSAQYDHRFFTPGTFSYHCTIHSPMTGVVTVSDAAPPGDTVMTVSIANMTSSGFQPSGIALRTGGHVTWTNNDNSVPAHTVTTL